ncbi:MAG TPA: flagellar biosynthetic protein FliR [Candidatus Nitrosotalea sp.]|nr:flagellar biosynthetic protein FliR [Candidatus Nitrosotalea sp.]
MVTGLLVFARCAGFVFRAPGFAHPSVPAAVRAALALAFAIAIVPAVRAAPVSGTGVAIAAALVAEFLFGAAIGMTASLLYDAAYAGGRVVDDYVGVRAIAPNLQLVAPSGFGRVWSLVFTGGFFLSGGYRVALLGFVRSFGRVPPGAAPFSSGWGAYAAHFASAIVLAALEVAAPAVALAFIVQIALGALSRVIPRFGSFTLAFPLAFAAALAATAVAAPLFVSRIPAPLSSLP